MAPLIINDDNSTPSCDDSTCIVKMASCTPTKKRSRDTYENSSQAVVVDAFEYYSDDEILIKTLKLQDTTTTPRSQQKNSQDKKTERKTRLSFEMHPSAMFDDMFDDDVDDVDDDSLLDDLDFNIDYSRRTTDLSIATKEDLLRELLLL